MCGCMMEEAKILYDWYARRGKEKDGYKDERSNDGI